MSEPDLLTVPEVAKLLRVGRGTVTRWIADGVLCSVRLGRQRRVTRAQLDSFLDTLEREGCVPPAWPHSKVRSASVRKRER